MAVLSTIRLLESCGTHCKSGDASGPKKFVLCLEKARGARIRFPLWYYPGHLLVCPLLCPFLHCKRAKDKTDCGNTFYHAGCILLLQTGCLGARANALGVERVSFNVFSSFSLAI